MIYLFSILCLVLLPYFYWHYTRRNMYKFAATLPGPLSLPFIGSAYLVKDIENIRDMLDNLIDQYGTFFRVWIFHVLLIIVTDPKYLQVLLNHPDCLDKDERYRIAEDVIGSGLITSPGKIWKQQRKLMNPAFGKKIVNSFVSSFIKHSEELVKELEKEVGKTRSFDSDKYVSRCTLDFICETAMGASVNAQSHGNRLLQFGNRAGEILIQRSLRVWLHFDIVFKNTALGREFYNLTQYLHDFTEPIIKKCQEKLKITKATVFNDDINKPFLEHYLTLNNDLTPHEIRQEVEAFIIAGSDTVSTTSQYALVALGMYQDVQTKAREELYEVFGDTDRPMVLEDVPKLQYLERVIKETMRLYTPLPFIARSVTKDIELDGHKIPAGLSILVPLFKVHRDPNLWEDPLKFDPDRFLPKRLANHHPYRYLPFSRGIRDCIGKAYALDACKVLLGTVLRSYQIYTPITPDTIRFKTEVTSKIFGGSQITIKKLKKKTN